MQQNNSKNLSDSKYRVALLTFLIASVVAAAVWQSFLRYSIASREYSEVVVRQKLLADMKHIQRSTSKNLHLGVYLASHTSDLRDLEDLNKASGKFADSFNCVFFPFRLASDSCGILAGNELLSPSALPGSDQVTWEVLRLLVMKGVSKLLDVDLDDGFRKFSDRQMRIFLDGKNEYEQTNFIRSAVRNFQSCFIKGRHYRFMWFPVFHDGAHETPDWLKRSVENLAKDNRFSLKGAVVVLYDDYNFKLAGGRRFETALIDNFAQTGCRLKIEKSVQGKTQQAFRPGLDSVILRTGNWLQTGIIVPDLDNRLVLLARKVPAETRSVSLMRNLVFMALLSWMSAIIYFVGNHVIMGRKVAVGLRTQLAAIVVIFLLPAFLLAMISTERYLDSSRNSALQRIRQDSVEALDALDKSVKLLRTRVCSLVDDCIHNASHLKNSSLINGTVDEQKAWLSTFLKSFIETGILMKNGLLLNSTGKMVSKFNSDSGSEEKFFQQLGASLFLPTINAMNPKSTRPDDGQMLMNAQAEEMLEMLGNVLPRETFPAMAHTFSQLTRLEGFGDRSFMYHRFLEQQGQVNGALMVGMTPSSLECLAFNRWFSNFVSEDFKPIWLVKKKENPDWFLKAPFGRVSDGGKFGMLKFVYGLLPAKLAYQTKIDGMAREPLVSDFSWNGQTWYFATQPGQDLFDYQLSVLVPLSEHHRHFALFKSELRSAMLLIFFLCGAIGWRLASGFVKPVRCFAETSDRLMEGDLTARMNENWPDEEFSQIAQKFNMVAEDVENGRILRKFVSAGALQTIVESEKLDLKKSMQTKKAVIMFVRLDGLWGSTAGKTPAEALAELNRFFSAVCSSVKKAGGEVSKFIAEKAMTTFFVADNESPGEKAMLALKAAIAVTERLHRHRLIGESCRVRVGISYGQVRAGIIGVESVRLEQTVIGDSVNLAARLCSHPGDFDILICGSTFEILQGEGLCGCQSIDFKHLPLQEIKGKKQAVEIYSVSATGYTE